jgi:hypothetical protein
MEALVTCRRHTGGAMKVPTVRRRPPRPVARAALGRLVLAVALVAGAAAVALVLPAGPDVQLAQGTGSGPQIR